MDIQSTKLELMQMILQTESADLLERVQKIFRKEEKDFWEELTQEQRDRINEGYQQALRGEGRPWEEIKKELLDN